MKKYIILSLILLGTISVNACVPDSNTIKNHPYYNEDDNSIEFSIEDVVDIVLINGKFYAEVDLYNDDYIAIEIPKEDFDIFMSYYDVYQSSSIAQDEWADTYGESPIFYVKNIIHDSIYHGILDLQTNKCCEYLDGWIVDNPYYL